MTPDQSPEAIRTEGVGSPVQCLLVAVTVSIPFAIVGIFFAQGLLRLMGATAPATP